MKYYVCKSRRLYEYLIKYGFKVIQIHPDRNRPSRDVAIFERTRELYDAIDMYYSIPKEMKW